MIENSAQKFILKSCVPMDSSHFVFIRMYILGDAVGGLKNRLLTCALCGLLWRALKWEQPSIGPCYYCRTTGQGFSSPGCSPAKSRERVFPVSCQRQEREPLGRLVRKWICVSTAAHLRAALAARPHPSALHSEEYALAKTEESWFTCFEDV